jgi:hypothetical protein
MSVVLPKFCAVTVSGSFVVCTREPGHVGSHVHGGIAWEDPEPVSHSEYMLRVQQLGEIRKVLRLPLDAGHREVLLRLSSFAEAAKAIDIDVEAIPKRYG